ncbi:LysR family transcriptional regulator [Shewanella sp. KCT]|uniref:LysR family transcriptional regulator n=1 Tax=Shewanella sp. KCT TaxID=2569535 RepID=UPI0011841842|nr:LysR family transcriptional regulator [Shewanella sp. KCT]
MHHNDFYGEYLTFAVICKTMSITDAAKILNKSKAHVSRQLSNLEARIGTNLFIRSSRNISLTDAGEVLMKDALELLAISREIDLKAMALSNELNGSFSITIPTSIATSFFPDVLGKLKKSYPNITFEIVTSNNIEPIALKNIDMAIRIGKPKEENYVSIFLGHYRDIFVASSSYNYSDKLFDNTIVINNFYIRMKRKFSINGKELDLSNFKSTIIVNETATQLRLLEQSFGIGLIPSFAFPFYQNSIRIVAPNLVSDELSVYLVYPYQKKLTNKTSKISKSIVQYTTEHLNNKKDTTSTSPN